LNYKYIVFDFDGTLADSIAVQNKILNELASKHHLDNIRPEDFKNRDNLTVRKKVQMLTLVVKIQSEFKSLYNQNISDVKPFDDVLSLLSLLNEQGYGVAIISSNAKENIEKFLKLNSIDFKISILSAKGLFGKHKAFTKFVKQHQCSVKDILYIGDEIRDVKACKKSGVDIVFAKWGMDADKDITSYNIKFIASSPLELQQFLIPKV
jgi:phosphoglycolate phosphatase